MLLIQYLVVVIVIVIIVYFRHHSNVRSRRYYLVWESFSHSNKTLWSLSGPKRHSPSDESRTYIRPFIRTRVYLAGSSRVTSRPSTLALLPQNICYDVTPPPRRPGRSWCWRPKSQASLRPASCLFYTFTRGSSSGYLS